MPMLDVSFMTSDPMLSDTFTVTRRIDAIDTHGRTVISVESVNPGIVGVITQQDPADLMRRDDGQMVPRQILVCSTFIFRGASKGYQPDVITFDGTDYTIKHVMNYSRFGGGTIEVIAESMNATDNPQD